MRLRIKIGYLDSGMGLELRNGVGIEILILIKISFEVDWMWDGVLQKYTTIFVSWCSTCY